MGWDLKATADSAMQSLPAMPSLPDMSANEIAAWVAGAVACFLLFSMLTRLVPRLWKLAEEAVFSNWRLALLGATGIALSLASGYTTWDGMRNFTGEALLSFLITFGIQGVMLIIAWLIGESFATGMSQTHSKGGVAWDLTATALFGVLVFTALGIWAGQGLTSGAPNTGNWFQSDAAAAIQNYAAFGAVGAIILAFVFALAKSDLGESYVQSARVIVKNSILWVMFLACMATSVFFSFDSLFTAIFPQEERVRAAELRAQNQVAGVVADIGATIESRRMTAAEELFSSEGWTSYNAQLVKLATVAKESEGEVEKYFHDQAEARNRAIAEQQERVTSAQSGQAGLAAKKVSLTDELSRLKGERPGLAAEYSEKKTALEERAKEIDAKRVEAMAEDKGVEGTGKVGKGPMWRERMGELGKLNDYYKVGEERVKDAKKRLDTVETRISQIERELAQVDGDLAKLKGEEETAGQRIAMTQSSVSVDDGKIIDPSRMLPGFEKARIDFREEPSSERLSDVQKVCSQILGAMQTATPATRAKVGGIDCDPKSAVEAAAVLFALNDGSKAFATTCAGGEKIAGLSSADALFGFSRRCLADSGLPSAETEALRTKINFMELNRDDKAHRFVVTWNAFQDGNRLAYLALAIAIAIDSLVFMSGLFGANAVRSPLSDVPSLKARSAQQLEANINAALGAHQYETAYLVLGVLRPITNHQGFSAIADLTEVHPGVASRVRMVLTAGADIGAVEAVQGPGERYRVRSELREYLSTVCDRHLKADASIVQQAKLEQLIREALRPYTHEHADIALNHFEPVAASGGYTSMVTLSEIEDSYEQRVVRRVVNAGATLDCIATEDKVAERYYVKPDVYRALLLIRANDPPSRHYAAARRGGNLGIPPPPSIAGGALGEARPQLPANPEMPRLTQQAAPRVDPAAHAQPSSQPRPARLRTADDLIEHFADELNTDAGLLARYIELYPQIDIRQIRNALQSVLRQNHSLFNIVKSADDSLGRNIEDARERFMAADGIDGEVDEVDDVATTIANLRTLFLLAPGGAYRYALTKMADELRADQAAGQLDDERARVVTYVESHLSELARADIMSKAGWDDVLASLKSFNYWLSTHAGNDQPPAGTV